MTHQALGELLKQEPIQQRCESQYESYGLHTLVVAREYLLDLCHFLKQDNALQFNFLSDICGVDYHPQTPRFETVYHLYSIPFRYRLRIKCRFEEDDAPPSVVSVWKTANWHEREAYDMYGISFVDHPDLRRIYMWEGYEGYPMRKDYPLRGYADNYNPFGEERSEEAGVPKSED
jgi:NADH-quinone oxidoreductase subunit C